MVISLFQQSGGGGSSGDKIGIAPPTVSSSGLVYDGTAKSPVIGSYNTDAVTVAYTPQTNAGTYSYTLALKDKSKYVWLNTYDSENQTGTWSIAKANGSSSLSKYAVELGEGESDNVVVTRAGTGAVQAVSSNPSIAAVSVSGTTVTILDGGTEGTATVSISVAADNNYNAVGAKNVTVEVVHTKPIYGVEWSGTSDTTMMRTDAALTFGNPSPAVNNGTGSSPFDEIMPWAGMKKVEDSAAGTLVEIPKYYYKWTKTGTKMTLQISPDMFDGALVSPAHADRGDGKGVRDKVYVGRYHCSTNDYKSTTGVQPKGSMTRANFRTNIHNLGSTIWQYDFAMYWTIAMLYLVEFADWNSQKVIGYGCSPSGSKANCGGTDSMQYHTGTSAANRTTYGWTQYRWIEGLWDNVYDWCDGIYFSSANVYCIKNPANFSDTSGGTLIGTRPTTSNYISAWNVPTANGFEYALYPSAVNGSDSMYVGDYCGYYSSGVVLRVGGGYVQSQNLGLFYLSGNYNASYSNGSIGSRLQKLP